MSVHKSLRAAIIGCGDISRSHSASMDATGIVLVAVCDLDVQLAKRKVAEFGHPEAAVYGDVAELLARTDIDLVTVATPVAMHAPLTIQALCAGKHVACEKPSALSLEENVAVAEASRSTGRRVIFFSSRNRYGMSTLAERHCRRHDLGEIYRVDVHMARKRGRPGVDIIQHAKWFINQRLSGGGVIMDMGQYYMDQVFHLTGWPEIRSVSASHFRGFSHQLDVGTTFDVEEQSTIFARAENGCTYTFDFSWIGHQQPRNEVIIRGTKGGLRLDGENRERPFTYYYEESPWQWMSTSTDWRDQRSGNDHVYGDLTRALRGEALEVGTTPEQAIKITRFTQMALRSAERGSEVTASEVPIPLAVTHAGV
jgi:predicted dehydrogenase